MAKWWFVLHNLLTRQATLPERGRISTADPIMNVIFPLSLSFVKRKGKLCVRCADKVIWGAKNYATVHRNWCTANECLAALQRLRLICLGIRVQCTSHIAGHFGRVSKYTIINMAYSLCIARAMREYLAVVRSAEEYNEMNKPSKSIWMRIPLKHKSSTCDGMCDGIMTVNEHENIEILWIKIFR